MSEELFERYLRNDLDEAGQRELSAILSTEEGARAFSEFVQEWTLLGEAALQRVAETKKIRRRAASPAPVRLWIGWAAGLAAAAAFMVAILTPTRLPPPVQPPRIAQNPPAPPAAPEPDRAPASVPRPDPPPVPVPPPARPAPAPLPTPEPQPPVPKPRPPEPAPRPTEPTRVAPPVVAVVPRVEGAVQVVSPAGRRKASAGEKLAPDEGLEIAGAATMELPDGARFDLGAESAVERISEKAGRKTVVLSRGSLSAVVPKQAAGRSVAVATPHAEIVVIGTQFSLAVTAESTKLEVREGRVRMTRLPDGASVEVGAGNGSVAAKGQRLESRPIVHTRDFQDGALYAGTRDTLVSGAEPGRAFGSESSLEVDGDEVDGKKIYALLKWDLSDVPAGAVIRSAVITLNVLNESQGSGYSFFEMKRSWSEVDATWTLAAPQQAWRVAGLKSALDRGTEVLGTVAPRVKGTLSVLLTPAAEAVIQGWARNPATNHGFLIANDTVSDGFRFSSREASSHNLRPKLTLAYTLSGK